MVLERFHPEELVKPPKEPVSLIVEHKKPGLIEVRDLVGKHTIEEWRGLFNRYARREVVHEVSTRQQKVSRVARVDFEMFEKSLLSTRVVGFNKEEFRDFKEMVRRANLE